MKPKNVDRNSTSASAVLADGLLLLLGCGHLWTCFLGCFYLYIMDASFAFFLMCDRR